ncbi:RES family NAD+ phosphorylase [Cupriavidus sp. SIMBA_020]|uniref:RES family NAD+ phosphorylase n=1 Tax=Cupriavidus sp. SIMBA_020 TaxID=3085766 RepID=UPI00397C48F0
MQLQTAEVLGCPLPPEDLAVRIMPVRQLDLAVTPLWRIHRSIYGPIHYNRRSTGGNPYRFDAPNDEFGVLYASPSFAGCMAEAVLRDRFQGHSLPLLLDEEELTQRSISDLGTTLNRPLQLADLTQPHFHLGMDNRVLSTADYRGPNLWSRAIHDAFPDLDGIYFTSRFANEPSVAIFDRAPMKARGGPVPLGRFYLLPGFLDTYNIGIAPPADPWQE